MQTLETLVTAYRPFAITDYEIHDEQQCYNENACVPPGFGCNDYCQNCHYTPSGCKQCVGGSCNWHRRCICNAPCGPC